MVTGKAGGNMSPPRESRDEYPVASILATPPVRTCVRDLPWLEKIVGVPVYAKFEHQQITGSFKYRGAVRAVNAQAGTVVAGSAGNHGLAVATVAQQLDVEALIVVPTNASVAKRDRIAATGAALIDHGESVQEAGDYARSLAESRGLQFLSPYNNLAMIGGGSDLTTEFLDQVPNLRHLVLPVGGGGLLAGAVEATRGRGISILACEPSRYAAMTKSLSAGAPRSVVPQPTIADGLAINLDRDAITLDKVRAVVESVLGLSEEELAAGTLAMLTRESTLVEPAGAAGVIATLRLAEQGLLSGPVGIPMTGGNIQRSTLSRIQRWDYSDPRLLSLLELRGRTVNDVVVAPPDLTSPRSAKSDDAVATPAEGLTTLLIGLESELSHCQVAISNHAEYLHSQALVESPEIVNELQDAVRRARERMRSTQSLLAKNGDAKSLISAEIELKAGRSTLAYARSALEWSSPSYAQAVAPQFFDERAQDSPRLNYDRYEHPTVTRIERQLSEALAGGHKELAATAVSSGMAAYSIIESFLIRHRLGNSSDSILVAPYIYFEATEQLASLPGVTVSICTHYSSEHILEQIADKKPRVVFLDAIANNPQLRCIDVIGIVERLRDTMTRPITVVIDGSMASGSFESTFFLPRGQVEVLYYESGSKYLQMGLDSAMAGVCIHPSELSSRFERLRRNVGAILYRTAAEQFPPYEPKHLQDRMTRIGNNAMTITDVLYSDEGVNRAGEIYYPGHSTHPDRVQASKLRHAGGCVTFIFREPGLNTRDNLNALIDRVISYARNYDVAVTKGVSFGFTVPRLSAAASMNEEDSPFLRIYSGDLGHENTFALARLVAEAITVTHEEL